MGCFFVLLADRNLQFTMLNYPPVKLTLADSLKGVQNSLCKVYE